MTFWRKFLLKLNWKKYDREIWNIKRLLIRIRFIQVWFSIVLELNDSMSLCVFWLLSYMLKCTLLFRNSWGRLMGKYLKQLVFKKMIKRTIYIASKFRNYKYNYKFKIKKNPKKICRSDLIVKRSGTRNNSNTWRWRLILTAFSDSQLQCLPPVF